MARRQAAVLLALALLPGAAALDFNVKVSPVAEATVVQPRWDNVTETVHEFNVSVDNMASVGCTYRLRGEFSRGNSTEAVHSGAYPMFPGTTSFMELKYVPLNYTGEVDADVDVRYCDRTEDVAEYSFEVNSSSITDARVETETLRVTEDSAEASFSVDGGELVPVGVPPYWKAGPSEVQNGSAEVEYEAPVFQNRSIEYAVVRDGELLGTATVELESPEPTLVDRILARKEQILLSLFAVSLLGNLYLARRRLLPDRLLEWIEEIELEGRDVRR
jgi:hypothetical protein